MSEQIEVVDLAPVEEPVQEEVEAAPPPPPLEREESLAPVIEEEPKPKRKGRPPGAKNKAKRKAPPPSEEDNEEYESEAPARNVRMQAPYREAQNLEMAQSLLDLMSGMAASKQNRRRQLYQSWF